MGRSRLAFTGFLLLFLLPCAVLAQNTNEVFARIDAEQELMEVQQKYTYQNSSLDTLNSIWFYDWNNAYSTKNSPLSKRFF